MKRITKKILSLLLVFCMIVGTIPASALQVYAAEAEGSTPQVEFTKKTPIGTEADLAVAESNTAATGYYLTGDIDLTAEWAIDGKTIYIDLNGHTIRQTASDEVVHLYSGELHIFDNSESGEGAITGGTNGLRIDGGVASFVRRKRLQHAKHLICTTDMPMVFLRRCLENRLLSYTFMAAKSATTGIGRNPDP